jgi:hypothetical protein
VTATCVPGVDAGTQTTTIQGFSGASWTGTVYAPVADIGWFAGSKDGTKITYGTPTGTYVQPVSGSAATLVDPNEGIGIFTNTGTDLLYLGYKTGILYRAPITGGTGDGGTGTEVAAGPFGQFLTSQIAGFLSAGPALSSDDNWLMLFSTQSTSQSFLSDIYLTSTAPGSTAKHLVSTTTGALMGDAFTADNTYSTYYSNVTLNGVGFVGDYDSVKLGPPIGAASDFAKLVWQNFSAATGTKTIYNDNYAAGANNGRADIEIKDVSGNTPATLLVTQADANIFMPNDRSKIIYSWSACPGAMTGVWAMPTP